MNFLYRTAAAPPPPPEPPRVPEQDDDFEKPIRTLEGLIAEDPHMPSSARPSSARPSEDGTEALPENWNDVSEMAQLQPLDRSFLFPGEQVHILACLSASKQDVRLISPFRVAALMSKNGNSLQHSTNKSMPISANDHDNGTAGENGCQDVENDQQTGKLNGAMSPAKHDILETQTLLQMEDHKQQIELILQRFRESNFFVRIAESDEPLWSKKRVSTSNIADGQNYSDSQEHNRASRNTAYNTVSDKGIFDGSTSGGVARDTVKCYPLQNGDIVNIAPAHAKDIVVFIDAITIVFEEASKGGAPLSLPIASIEVLTLEATNMTSENLTLTVLAPEASGSSSVVSLNSSPTTPNSQNDGLNESARRSGLGKHVGFRGLNSVIAGSPKEGDSGGNRAATASGCTHLWLQSAVPLGCVPAHSSTTVKLELLPLTDGIITLDTLQITAREKGLTYIPEHSLEIHATSGISSGRA
ncbi:hypothetical protein PR202_gb23606 [Eleusine coracana subsp. coracana]|uniref:Uncharacterized protein n=1 Tax=Eleusine coracana subsp. coracana TaxID=191504 RepID=A0AAV5FKC3_ELECO|nr:hypothetical protein PR202_gb23606 [Eleusine coracana subsp. coracana]